MADRIVHFGTDSCRRLLVLASTGYDVEPCGTSLAALQGALQRKEIDAVTLSEAPVQLAEQAATVARSLTSAPIILFEDGERGHSPGTFDHIVEACTGTSEWLRQIAEVIGESCRIRKESGLIRQRSLALREQSAATREISQAGRRRAQREHERAQEVREKIRENQEERSA